MEALAPPAPARPMAVAAAAVAVLALVGAATRTGLPIGEAGAVSVAVTVPEPEPDGLPQAPAGRLRLVDPAAPPDARVVAVLGGPTGDVLDRMGPPALSQAETGGTVHTWRPSALAEVSVRGWDDGGHEVNGFFAQVLPGEDARLAVDGVVVGHTTLRQAVAEWGGPYEAAAYPGGDYAVAWDVCDGSVPVVVKLDVAGRGGRPVADPFADPLGHEPVTSVLVAYADESPAACAA